MESAFLSFFLEQRAEILDQTIEHLWLTFIALGLAIVVAVPLGIVLTRKRKAASAVIGVLNVIQTIPSLALLGFMIPLLGIGAVPAIVALFLYALLPVVRNTYTGISEIDPAVKEAAIGMGLTDLQVLFRIELPLSIPMLFAGIKTATVINIGVTTLAALIGAGGLGEFIFRGIALNNSQMILAGAIPAALLAVISNYVLGLVERSLLRKKGNLRPALGLFVVLLVLFLIPTLWSSDNPAPMKAGFPSEFIHREDGYDGLRETYNLDLEVIEMDPGLMYDAVKNGDVDIASGFSTDGRIISYDLVVLKDDKHYFPPYFAAPLVRQAVLSKYPELRTALNKLSNLIDDDTMSKLNLAADQGTRTPRQVATTFLDTMGFKISRYPRGNPAIVIGSKNFTESFILAELLKILIENQTGLEVELKLGFGGTKLVFDALTSGQIDLYPEYTGTGLLVLLPERDRESKILYDPEAVYEYVKDQFRQRYDLEWLEPFGFNNTHAMIMRRAQVNELGLTSVSDLSAYLESWDK